ncbi:Uncharacterised protein [Klebsiella pneumoniae]|uniref:Uncharacterized protein n=1 Tax=Klebsiella pneumoniae TaxID=573 RepID=A0A4P0Y1N9_KLEPN|nr:Uncharacterised protein [Klebsiella pneumoniae]
MAIHGRPDNASSEVNGGYFASSSGEATTQRGTSASSTDTVAGSTSAPTRNSAVDIIAEEVDGIIV